MPNIDWSSDATAQMQPLSPDLQQSAKALAEQLRRNPDIGIFYQHLRGRAVYAVAGSTVTVCYTKNHPTRPTKLQVVSVFPTNLASQDDYEQRQRR